ncbi:MAG: GxxExxY protein [Planctomycetaceae bacterium]|jgi:GxxExxY protein|nr:GxxExxY protein [Planctomycetaceae bacterium]
MTELLYKNECYTIQNAIFAVYKEIGSGFLEAVYQECLENELRELSVPFERQKELRLYYKGKLLEQTYRADIICYDKIILELKAVTEIGSAHKSQILNYLKMSKLELGLLVNFGHYPNVEIARIVNSKRF